MKSLLKKDIKIRKNFNCTENLQFIKKNILKNKNLPNTVRWNIKVKKSSKIFSMTKINNRCMLTTRNKGMIRIYKLSRISFLRLCRDTFISGFKKSVW